MPDTSYFCETANKKMKRIIGRAIACCVSLCAVVVCRQYDQPSNSCFGPEALVYGFVLDGFLMVCRRYAKICPCFEECIIMYIRIMDYNLYAVVIDILRSNVFFYHCSRRDLRPLSMQNRFVLVRNVSSNIFHLKIHSKSKASPLPSLSFIQQSLSTQHNININIAATQHFSIARLLIFIRTSSGFNAYNMKCYAARCQHADIESLPVFLNDE